MNSLVDSIGQQDAYVSLRNAGWEPSGPAPEVYDMGLWRPHLKISSDEFADWLGINQKYAARMAKISWSWATKKQQRSIQHHTTHYRPNAKEDWAVDVYGLGHRAALRLCKLLQPDAVPTLQKIFAEYRRQAALPRLEADNEYGRCVRWMIGNAAYHSADRIMEAFGHDLAEDADRYAGVFTVNRPISVQMVGDVLEVCIYDARDFSLHKERSLLQIKRMIRSVLSTCGRALARTCDDEINGERHSHE